MNKITIYTEAFKKVSQILTVNIFDVSKLSLIFFPIQQFSYESIIILPKYYKNKIKKSCFFSM